MLNSLRFILKMLLSLKLVLLLVSPVFGAAENGPHFLAYTFNEMIGWNSVLANASSQKYA